MRTMTAHRSDTEETTMKMLVRFAPFIVFTLLERAVGWRVGVFAAFVTLVVVLATSRPRRVGLLSGAMLAFFAAGSVLAVVAPQSGLGDYLNPLSTAWIGLVTGIALVLGHPFTADIAQARVSPAMAASPAFRRVNQAISARWVAAFLVMAAASMLAIGLGRPMLGTAATIVALVAAVEYSERAPRRLAPVPAVPAA
jgi:hypothetical protein